MKGVESWSEREYSAQQDYPSAAPLKLAETDLAQSLSFLGLP